MDRPFNSSDNGKRCSVRGAWGRLEFPLQDQGTAEPDEAIIWYDVPRSNGWAWEYVKPIDITDLEN